MATEEAEFYSPGPRTKVRRLPERGVYDPKEIYAILDVGFVCHVGFVVDNEPIVIPTGYGRRGNRLYLHGSKASRTLKALSDNANVCITVTHVDGVVLARSVFHSSINYRSVVMLGRTHELVSDEAKMEALAILANGMAPGWWDKARVPTKAELDETRVIEFTIEEASAKVRTGGPKDDKEDIENPELMDRVWGGVIPLQPVFGEPIPDTVYPPKVPAPSLERPQTGK